MKTWLRLQTLAVFHCLVLAVGLAAADDQTNAMINCQIQQGPCIRMVADCKVGLDILPKPVKAMQDLIFRVTVEGPLHMSQPPYIDLNMPAMDMGPNRVLLKQMTDGVFEGRGVIVRCRSGDKTWQAKLTFPGAGSTTFVFDVVY